MKINTSIKNSEVYKFTLDIKENDEIVSIGSIIINFRKDDRPVGLIEDIWTKESHRKKGFATKIIKNLIEISKDFNCYKCVLSCSSENVDFYKKIGFNIHQNTMRYNLY